MNKPKKQKKAAVDFDVLEQMNLSAAGIDIGAEEVYVCVPPGRTQENVRAFGTFTADLQALADWLGECGIETVAMESTSIYWIALYDILEGQGIEVCLVNARHLKNVSGRKSDVADCQWLQQLHTYGLLRGSFHPPDEIRALRALARHREMLVRYRAAHIQHMQKALELMNLKLTLVLSDITGVTGMSIIRAILAGERDAAVLAEYRDSKCKHSEAEIAKALHGHYREEHLFALRQAVELYDIYGGQIEATDAQMKAMYASLEPPEDNGSSPTTPPDPSKRAKRRKNQAHFDLAGALYQMAGVDLTAIDGIDALTAQTILTEVGVDMSRWASEKHFTSWLGLCPNNRLSGGKVKGRRTRKTDNRANTALRVAAQSLARSNSALGAFYRRIKARHGPAKAVVATAHKLARIIYHMLKNHTDYRDIGADYYDAQQRERAVKRVQRQAARLGFLLIPTADYPPVPFFVSE